MLEKFMYICFTFLLICSGCSMKEDKIEHKLDIPINESNEKSKDILLTSNDREKNSTEEYAYINIIINADNIVEYNLYVYDFNKSNELHFTGRLIDGSSYKKGSDAEYEFSELAGFKSVNNIDENRKLLDSDFVTIECSVIDSEGNKQNCTNMLKIENSQGYHYGNIYLSKVDDNYQFSLVAE